MPKKPLAGKFVKVNTNWVYTIQHSQVAPPIRFEPQKDGKWLVHAVGRPGIRILAPKVVVKMLNQALESDFRVVSRNTVTNQVISLEAAKVTK